MQIDCNSDEVKTITKQVLEDTGLTSFLDNDTPVKRPPLKGESSVIPVVSELNVITDLSRREVELSSQIDNLIKNRRSIREDLAKANKVDDFEDFPALGLPQRLRGKPIVTSDIKFTSNIKIAPPFKENAVNKTGNVINKFIKKDESRQRVDINKQRKGNKRRDKTVSIQDYDNDDTVFVGKTQSFTARNESDSTRIGSHNIQRKDSLKSDNLKTPEAGPSRVKTRRAPKTAAVCIKRGDDGPTYAQILNKARERIPITELGINNTKIRWAMNGAMIIEVAGDDMNGKADLLANKLRSALNGEALISRPIAKGEIRIWGLDDSTSQEEIACIVAEIGGCSPLEVIVAPITKMRNRLGMSWIRCPLSVAIKVASSGKIRIGWTVARVELSQARPIQCFRCWNYGHMRSNCKSAIDRTGSCFRCGNPGHSARQCNLPPRCVICEHGGRSFNHRIGSFNCVTMKENGSRNRIGLIPDRRPDFVSNPDDI